jgi:hypothetical protein
MLVYVYAKTVQRGPWGMRCETPVEVAALGSAPWSTAIYAEQRVPQYPRVVGLLEPAFAVIHAVDVRARNEYWHEEITLEFDEPPDFAVSP